MPNRITLVASIVIGAITAAAPIALAAHNATPVRRASSLAPAKTTRNAGRYIYVSDLHAYGQQSVGAVEYYPVGANGDVPPAGEITGSNTLLTGVTGIVVDSRGEIYVANAETNTIIGFAAGATGNVAPNLVIGGAATGLASPMALAFDRRENLYVINCGTDCNYGPPGPPSIEEFARGSNGNIAPIRTISGSQTGFAGGHLNGLALDSSGNMYVAQTPSTIIVFSRTASGNDAPARVITGERTKIANPTAIAVGKHSIYLTSTYSNYVDVLPRNASGDARPRWLLDVQWESGGPSSGYMSGLTIAPDASIYVTGYVPLIAQFAANAKKNAPPITVIQGPDTGLVLPNFVYVR